MNLAVAIGEEELMANNVARALYLDPGIPSVATVDLDGSHGCNIVHWAYACY